MKPVVLNMQAFGSYGKKKTIDFRKPSQNLFLITGDTGAGKSTIFDAIVFALYGEASSGNNKKNGMELQSQFVSFDLEPFVELVFTEGQEEYTIRRVPRHKRPLKRGTGFKDESESVSLRMPDGSEYPQKETDAKIKEIVGLTKEQFMQVAMIAQGEFMELLRAKSDDKKEIFRKLFNTELYQKIVEEFARRRKEKSDHMKKIYLEFKTEAGHIRIPEDYPAKEEVEILLERIRLAKEPSIADLESFMERTKELRIWLEDKTETAQEQYDRLSKERDHCRDEKIQAENLLRNFEQKEAAEKELRDWEGKKEEMRQAELFAEKIDHSYEIKAVYIRYKDAAKLSKEMEENLREKEQILPELLEKERLAREAKTAAEEAKRQENDHYAAVLEQVKKAREIFADMKKTEDEIGRNTMALKQASKQKEENEEAQKQWEEFAKSRKERQKELQDASKNETLWKTKREAYMEIYDLYKEQDVQKKDLAESKRKAEESAEQYVEAKQAYDQAKEQYDRAREDFLNDQAGFLAREKLKPGQPCPVCGSLTHPAPCTSTEKQKEMTREQLDAWNERVDILGKAQETAAGVSRSAETLYREKEKNRKAALQTLVEKMKKHIPSLPEDPDMAQIRNGMKGWREQLVEEQQKVKEEIKEAKQTEEELEKAEAILLSLKQEAEQHTARVLKAAEALSASKAKKENMQEYKGFSSEEEAENLLKAAKTEQKKKETAAQQAETAAVAAKEELDRTQTLITRYKKELPGHLEEQAERKQAYVASMKDRDLSERDWVETVKTCQKEKTAELRDRIHAYTTAGKTAEALRQAAVSAIGDRRKPDPEQIREKIEQAETAFRKAAQNTEEYKDAFRAAERAYGALEPKMEERCRILEEHRRLNSLYNMLGGNVTDGRMDIETFVQRYYLERILYAANRRFQDMSAGQFELRMLGKEQAAKGKNKGLDLMVYSTVTGKEREIRTLSGGESFMAALSLALGMADQIQADSAAINLDMMFIDEGFGSLDDNSRNQAVKVLKSMAGGSRLIGIISHVTELKQEIDDQLIVKKDENGSYINWEIS